MAEFWWHWLSAQDPVLGLEDAVGSCTFETWTAPGIPEQDGLQGQGQGQGEKGLNRAHVDREALREASTQARTPDLEMPVEAEAWILWSSWASSGSVTELGLGPKLLTCQRNQPRNEQAGVGGVPDLLNLHSITAGLVSIWIGQH